MTKPKSKPWWIYASRNPEDSYGSTIIQDRALEGADSKELAELAANQFKGALYAGDAALLAMGVPALWNIGKTIGALPTLGRVVGGIVTGAPKGAVGYMAGKYIDQKHPFGENSGVASEVLSRLLGFPSWGIGAKAGEKVATKIGKSIGDKIDKVNRGVEKYFVRRYFNRLDPNSLRIIPTPNTNTGDDIIRPLGDNIPTTSQSNLDQSPIQATSQDSDFWDTFVRELGSDYDPLIPGSDNDLSIIGRIPQQERSFTGPRWTFLNGDLRMTISDMLNNNSVRWYSGTIGPNFTNRRNGVTRILVQPADGEHYIMQSDLPGSPFRRVNETRRDWSNVSHEDLGDILDTPSEALEFDSAFTEFQRRLNDPNTPGDQLYSMTRRHFDTPGVGMAFTTPTLNFTNSEFNWVRGRGFVFRPSATPHQVRDAINNVINSAPRGSVFVNRYSANSLPLALHAPINNYGTGSGQMRIIPMDAPTNTNMLDRGVTFSDLFSESFLWDPSTPQSVRDWHSSFINREINNDVQLPEDVRGILTQRASDLYNKFMNRVVNKNQQLWNRARALDPELPEFRFRPTDGYNEHILDDILITGHAPLKFWYPDFIIQKYNKGGKARFNKFSRINNNHD